MSVIADFSIPADDFTLGGLLEVRQGVRVRLESMIPTGRSVVPYFWAKSEDADAVETALRDADIVEEVAAVDEVDDETLFRVEWSGDVDGFIESITAADAIVLDGEGHGDCWSFQLRFAEYDDLSEFYRTVVDKGISVDLEGVRNPLDSTQVREFGLTHEQREALLLALEEGYFAVPREITMVELAEKLGVSDSAVSQRLRRGLAKILSVTLLGNPPGR